MNSKEFIEFAKKEGIDQIQIMEKNTMQDYVMYINEERKKYEMISSVQYEIKAEQEGKTVKLRSNYLDSSLLSDLILKFKYVEEKNEDYYLTELENNNTKAEKEIPQAKEALDLLEQAISLKNKEKEIVKIELSYEDCYQQIRIINSNGVDMNTSQHTYAFSVEVLAKRKEVSISSRREKMSSSPLEFKTIVQDAIMEAKIRLNEKVLSTSKYKVIFQNEAAGNLIRKIMEGLSAEEVQRKKTLFYNQLHQKIGVDILNIIEDPTNQNYPGYQLFDEEGTKTTKKDVVRNGILKTFFYDNKTALKEKITSTGNGYGNISTRNLYVEPGKYHFTELIEQMKEGIVVTHYACAIDAVHLDTGNLSLQIFGYQVKDGKIVGGIKPAILTTSFEEILNHILAIGDDLVFTNPKVGSPSLLIDQLSVVLE